jgi:mRNA interferase RelE/StbE
MLKIEISKRTGKFLSTLPPKQGRQLAVKIQQLRENPEPSDSIQLKGFSPYRPSDQGEYRIIYFVQEDILRVDLIGKRNDDDIYKQLKRL